MSGAYSDDEPRDFLLEAEKILQDLDLPSLVIGIEPTPRPLRQMLNSGDADVISDAVNALGVLLQGPNGRYRKIAALAVGQLGLDFPSILEFLAQRRAIDLAPDVRAAIASSLATLRSMPCSSNASDLDRRRMLSDLYQRFA